MMPVHHYLILSYLISYLHQKQLLLVTSSTAICRISELHNNFIASVGDFTMHCSNYCMDLTPEGLKMTQVDAKHVALRK
jgi:hypothetical protein